MNPMINPFTRRVAGAIAVISLLLVQPAAAHRIYPKGDSSGTLWVGDRVTTSPGATTMLVVADAGSCSAQVWINLPAGSPLQVSPPEGFGVHVELEITAPDEPGEYPFIVHWVGEDKWNGTDGPCQEDSQVDFSPPGVQLFLTVEALPEPTSTANDPMPGVAGDPVDLFTGELFFHEEPDLFLGGPLPLYFQRYYASKLRLSHIVGDLGDHNWLHNFEWRVHRTGNHIVLLAEHGKALRYLKSNDQWDLVSRTDNQYQLVEDGQDLLVGDARNRRIYRFNAWGKLAGISDGRGNMLYLTYDGGGGGKLIRVQDHPETAKARAILFSYEGNREPPLLVAVTERFGFTGGRSTGFSFTGENLTEVQDAGNNYTQYEYHTDHADPGLLVTVSPPENNQAWFHFYNELGKVGAQHDSNGNIITYSYTPGLRPQTATVTDPYGRNTSYHFDAENTGSLIGVTDPLNRRIDIEVNDQRLREQIASRGGALLERGYHPQTGAVVRQADENGNETLLTYSPRDAGHGITFQDLVRIQYADGTEQTWSYDASGNPISRTDRAGTIWNYTYNSFGQILTATNPAGAVTTFTYDDFRNRTSVQDDAGNLTSFEYDAFKRLNRITWADGSERTFTYNPYNQVTAITDERANTSARQYDRNRRLIAVTDPEGNTTEYEYDSMERLVKITYPAGNPLLLAYEKFGRIAQITQPNGNILTYTYDEVGRLLSVADSLGTLREQTFDADGALTGFNDALDNTTSLNRDAAGRLVAAVSPHGRTTSIHYDRLNRPVSTNAGGLTRRAIRDPNGWIVEAMLPGSLISTDYDYDALGNVIGITDPRGNPWLRVHDDQGRLVATVDPLGNVTSYSRDHRNRVSEIELPLSKVTLTRDGAGNVTRRLYSDGTDLSYSYDKNQRLTAASGLSLAYDANGRITQSNGLAIERDGGGRISRITFGPGKWTDYVYNLRDQLTGISDWLGGQTDFSYDAAGRLTRITRPNGIQSTYSYDGDGLVIAIEEKQGTMTLAALTLVRDGLGQVQSADRTYPAGTPPLTLSALAMQAAYDDASQTADHMYDAMGRRLSDGVHDYVWDLASRLVSYTRAGQMTQFTYDALGQRISRTAGGIARDFTWNYALDLPSISVMDEGGSPARYYVHTPAGALLYSIDAATAGRRFYHFDEMGNAVMVTGPEGAILASYRYGPYGEALADSSEGALDNPFIWQGQWGIVSEEGGAFYYTRARYYDPARARFLSRDPFRSLHPQSINPYQFVHGNPLRYIDPLGLNPHFPSEMPQDVVRQIGEGIVDHTGADVDMQIAMFLFPDQVTHSIVLDSFNRNRLALEIDLPMLELPEMSRESIINQTEPFFVGLGRSETRVTSLPQIAGHETLYPGKFKPGLPIPSDSSLTDSLPAFYWMIDFPPPPNGRPIEPGIDGFEMWTPKPSGIGTLDE